MADEAKAKGYAAFSSGDFAAAAAHFSDAIAIDPTNHVFFSNRSAAYASLNKFSEALDDAKQTVKLKPYWAKGYSRLGAAHQGLGNYEDAIASYKKGLDIAPSNDALKSGLADAQSAARSRPPPSAANPSGDVFSGPGMWPKLAADPSTRSYLQQPDFMKMMQDIQRNPNNLNLYLKDQRVMQALGVLLNVKIGTPGDDMEMPEVSLPPPPSQERKRPAKAEPEPMEEVSGEEKEEKERKVQAQKEKEAGNAAYKKKDFETAIERYSKALELNDTDISFLTNRADVYLEMGKYEECIKDCDKAVERGRELRSDYKMVTRALIRKGTALVKMAKSSKDFDTAIEAFQKALTEHRNPDTLKRLNEAEKAKKDLEQQEYFDPKLGDEEREKGNEYFKQQNYPEAIKHYTESLRRNPKDPKAYSNRAACYTKLGAMPEGLKDAEKCIELDPTFSKGYTRKGAVQYFMKEYEKALETYQLGLKHDPNNQDCIDGVRRCVEQINKASRGDLSPDEIKERQAKGMQDPEGEVQTLATAVPTISPGNQVEEKVQFHDKPAGVLVEPRKEEMNGATYELVNQDQVRENGTNPGKLSDLCRNAADPREGSEIGNEVGMVGKVTEPVKLADTCGEEQIIARPIASQQNDFEDLHVSNHFIPLMSKVLEILQTRPLNNMSAQHVQFMEDASRDLSAMHFPVEWLSPYVEKAKKWLLVMDRAKAVSEVELKIAQVEAQLQTLKETKKALQEENKVIAPSIDFDLDKPLYEE